MNPRGRFRLYPMVARGAVVLVLMVVLALLWHGWRACAQSGGHYVRGLFWMECIRP